MKQLIFAGAACAMLAACGNDPEVNAENASVAEVAQQVREAGGSANMVRPGQWQSKITFVEMNMPGAPPEAQAALRSMNQNNQVHESCLTPEQAKRPREEFFAGDNKDCRYEHFTMGNGKIDATMQCGREGITQTMAMKGTYGPDDYNMEMTMRTAGMPGAPEGMTMKMRVDAKRTGECTGKST